MQKLKNGDFKTVPGKVFFCCFTPESAINAFGAVQKLSEKY